MDEVGITINGVKYTLEEAKEIYEALVKIFGEPLKYTPVTMPGMLPYPTYRKPYEISDNVGAPIMPCPIATV